MNYSKIVAEHSEKLSSDIDYIDDCENYIVYCNIDFYGYADDEADIYDDIDKREYIGTITGYIIMCQLMDEMGIDAYIVCDDYSADLEMAMSVITNHNREAMEDDVFYIDNVKIKDSENDELFKKIVKTLPDIILKHYHIFPKLMVYYPEPMPYEKDENSVYRAKEQMAGIVARDIFSQSAMGQGQINESDEPKFQVRLDEEQLNYLLGRWNDYSVYPESAKNTAEFQRFESVGFAEMRKSRLLYKWVL